MVWVVSQTRRRLSVWFKFFSCFAKTVGWLMCNSVTIQGCRGCCIERPQAKRPMIRPEYQYNIKIFGACSNNTSFIPCFILTF